LIHCLREAPEQPTSWSCPQATGFRPPANHHGVARDRPVGLSAGAPGFVLGRSDARGALSWRRNAPTEELLALTSRRPGLRGLLRRHRAPCSRPLAFLGDRERAEDPGAGNLPAHRQGGAGMGAPRPLPDLVVTIARNLCVDQARRDASGAPTAWTRRGRVTSPRWSTRCPRRSIRPRAESALLRPVLQRALLRTGRAREVFVCASGRRAFRRSPRCRREREHG